MTLELELSPELEAQLRADALARQVPVETLAAHAISAALAFSSRYPERNAQAPPVADQIVTTRQTPSGAIDDATRKRLAAVDAGLGMFAGVGDTVDEFMAKRSAEEEMPVLPKGGRRAAIQAARGSLRGLVSSDEFLAARHAEAQSELEKSRSRDVS